MTPYRPPVLPAVLSGVAVMLLYILTLAPTTAFWDASEYIATAHILGIPHPPGNPLFVVLAKVWTLLLAPTGLSVAVRVNLFAAATTAVACGFFFLVAHRILVEVVDDARVALVGSAVSVLLAATAFTVWNQSNVNEKVYTVSVMILAIVSWLALLWRDRRDDPRSARWLILAVYLMVLGSTNHLMSLLPAPALGLFVLMVGPAVLLRGDVWAKVIPVVLLGLSFNFFLPIRADQRPVINEGDPQCQEAVGTAVAVFSKGRLGGCPDLASVLLREQYSKPPVTQRMAPIGHQLLNYFQYFDWQWSRGLDASEVPGNARIPVSLIFMGLGFLGLAVCARAHRDLFAYMATTAAILTVGLVFYLNFRYGYSLAPEVTDRAAHEVRERDYFFIASFIVWGVLAGMGLTLLWWELSRRVGSARRLLVTSPILALAFIPLVLNWGWATRSGDYAARSWAYNLLMSVEPYGVIFTNGDNDTFPLWYMQEVEGIRKDVTVVVVQYLYTTWYPKQLQELTVPQVQRPFNVDQDGHGIYTGTPTPTRPLLSLTPEQMDAVGTTRLSQDFTIPLGSLSVQYPAGTILNRGQLLALTIIRDSVEERPIHFSSVAGLLQELGLEQWSVRQGMGMKLVLEDPALDPERFTRIAPELGGDWVDWERTRTLSETVFLYEGLRNREIWADRASLNIPWHYYFLYLTLADVAERRGLGDAEVERLAAEADAFMAVARGGIRGTPEG